MVEKGVLQTYRERSPNETSEKLALPWVPGASGELSRLPLPSRAGVLAVRLINQALVQADPEKTLAALLLPAAALPDVAVPTARRYHDVLARAQRLKAQVGWHHPWHPAKGARGAM